MICTRTIEKIRAAIFRETLKKKCSLSAHRFVYNGRITCAVLKQAPALLMTLLNKNDYLVRILTPLYLNFSQSSYSISFFKRRMFESYLIPSL